MLFVAASLLGCAAAVMGQNDTTKLGYYYQQLQLAFNDRYIFEYNLPQWFDASGVFCAPFGLDCRSGPDAIEEYTVAWMQQFTDAHAVFDEFREAGTVGSFGYEASMDFNNSCELYMEGYVAYTLDDAGALDQMINFFDAESVETNIRDCNYLLPSSWASEEEGDAKAAVPLLGSRKMVPVGGHAAAKAHGPADSHRTILETYFSKLTNIWNTLPQLTTVYPKMFDTNGVFCPITGVECWTGPQAIAKGLLGWTTNMSYVYSQFDELRIAGDVASYGYTKTFTYKNGCSVVIDGYSGYMVDFSTGRLSGVWDFLDLNEVSQAVAFCQQNPNNNQ